MRNCTSPERSVCATTLPPRHASRSPSALHLERHDARIGDLFRVTKNRRKARAVIFSHQFGWPGRLTRGTGVVASVPDAGRSFDHRRTMESCHDRQRMVVTVSWSRVRSSGFSYVVGLTIIGQGSGGWPADFGASTQFGWRPKPPSLTCSHAASRRDVSDGMAHTSLRPSLVTRDGPFIAFRRPRQVFPFV